MHQHGAELPAHLRPRRPARAGGAGGCGGQRGGAGGFLRAGLPVFGRAAAPKAVAAAVHAGLYPAGAAYLRQDFAAAAGQRVFVEPWRECLLCPLRQHWHPGLRCHDDDHAHPMPDGGRTVGAFQGGGYPHRQIAGHAGI